MIKIQSMQQLKRESRHGAEFFIRLRFNLRSTKWIEWDAQSRVFNVINFIDGSEQILTEKQLMDQEWSLIGQGRRPKAGMGCFNKPNAQYAV